MDKPTIEQLAELVREMRSMQTNYFKAARSGRRDEAVKILPKAKILEARVDTMVKEILDEPIAEQKSLF